MSKVRDICYIDHKTGDSDHMNAHIYTLACAAQHRHWVEGCAYCAKFKPGEMFPSHDASRRCESGGRDHCTCDTCF